MVFLGVIHRGECSREPGYKSTVNARKGPLDANNGPINGFEGTVGGWLARSAVVSADGASQGQTAIEAADVVGDVADPADKGVLGDP